MCHKKTHSEGKSRKHHGSIDLWFNHVQRRDDDNVATFVHASQFKDPTAGEDLN